ncbi:MULTISPECIES: metalloregulator ArsR/SmtB family transcription factor [Cerasicoccaceae]|uniref:ArsR/SmtB family transcription factor n=1 Tax=Cerasicoccaceae TaxID=3056374 RepID=UPI001C73C225|nr:MULTISPECIES: metalloregulator ArsR/SmtB family transcription factor [Cerasicoccaceae]QYY35475.1 metalloregulator ArsR/SmtB family transcription factor [Ruficoccus sp. ZRK36]
MIDPTSASAIFKSLSDLTRLRIVRLLVVNQTEMCVCELVDALNEKQYNVSKQVKILESAGILESNKEGRWIYYGLKQNKKGLLDSIYTGVAMIEDKADLFTSDQKRVEARMQLREDGRCKIGLVQTENGGTVSSDSPRVSHG